MQSLGSWPLLLVSLLSCLFQPDTSLAFSLKNCTVPYSENALNVLIMCGQRGLTVIPDDIPRSATSLDISSNSILKVTRTDLRGLSRLKALQAEYNSISHIDDGAFADLVELEVLNLYANMLTNLTAGMFQGLTKLLKLSLSDNHISFISPEAFQFLVSMRSVDLGSNHLRLIIDIAPILKLLTLQDLHLGYNKFTSFQSDDLPLNVSNLTLLGIPLCSLRNFSIRKDIFPHLQMLDLRKCSSDIEWDVPHKTFLRSLTSLFLGGSYISFEAYIAMLQTADSLQDVKLQNMKKWIDDGLVDVACQTPSLRSLDLTFNEISFIDAHLLQSCSQLSELSLSSNHLSDMSERALQSMTQLRLLSLDSNNLSKVPLALRALATLENLDLSSNFINELNCLDFQNLTKLTNLNLKRNRISSVQACVFQNLNNLKVLDIGENDVFSIENTFKVNLCKLESLNLQKNGLLNVMQGDFKNLSSLRNLDLDSYRFYFAYDGAFEGLDHLQTLTLLTERYTKELFRGLPHLETLTLHIILSWNHKSFQKNDEPPFSNLPNLKTLVLKDYRRLHFSISPDLLSGLKSLEYLMTEKFFMRSLHPDTFKYTPRLKGLQIIQSALSHLTPEHFRPIPNLKTLDLSNNKLRSLDFLAKVNLQQLGSLKLGDNKLSIINETIFNSLPALIYLELADNPLTCECSNVGFNRWIQSNNKTQVVNGHQYTCAFPVSQQGNKFLDFDIHSCWIDASFLCFISSTCLILFTLLTSFTYHFLRWHLMYAYYLFLAFLFDNKRRKNGNPPHHYDAFVSYNVHDEVWVYRELLPELEGQQGWRLCLHHRDFEPGKPIIENITEAIYSSKKTICVISRHYLQSEWCSREIQMASFRLFDEHKDVLIMLFLEDIPARQLSPYYRMRSLVKRSTYLSWPQAGQHAGVFWQNVRRALETAENLTEQTHPLSGHPDLIQ